MVSSAMAHSIFIKVQDLHASKSEEREKEGTNFSSFHEFSRKRLDILHMFLVSSCASLCWENGCHVRLWLRCEFSTLCIANILFRTRAHRFCIYISCVVNNIESKFHVRPTCGRWPMKPNSYILLMIQIFRTKIYIPNLSQITEGVLKFHPQVSTRGRIITV